VNNIQTRRFGVINYPYSFTSGGDYLTPKSSFLARHVFLFIRSLVVLHPSYLQVLALWVRSTSLPEVSVLLLHMTRSSDLHLHGSSSSSLVAARGHALLGKSSEAHQATHGVFLRSHSRSVSGESRLHLPSEVGFERDGLAFLCL
jgi:hypothetical protein